MNNTLNNILTVQNNNRVPSPFVKQKVRPDFHQRKTQNPRKSPKKGKTQKENNEKKWGENKTLTKCDTLNQTAGNPVIKLKFLYFETAGSLKMLS